MLKHAVDEAHTLEDTERVKLVIEEYVALCDGKFFAVRATERYISEMRSLPANLMLREEQSKLTDYLLEIRNLKCLACRMPGH